MSLDMRPLLPRKNQANVALGDPELQAYLSLRKPRSPKSADFHNRILIEMSATMMRSASEYRAAFLNAIHAIVRRGSEKQMGWAKARLVVASMANPHAFRDRAMNQAPSEPMDQNRFIANLNQSVAVRNPVSRPFDAGAIACRFLNYLLQKIEARIFINAHGVTLFNLSFEVSM